MSLFRRIAVEQLLCGSVAVGCYGSVAVAVGWLLWDGRCESVAVG